MSTNIATKSDLTADQIAAIIADLSTEARGRLLWGGHQEGQPATTELLGHGLIRIAPEHGGAYVLTVDGAEVMAKLLDNAGPKALA